VLSSHSLFKIIESEKAKVKSSVREFQPGNFLLLPFHILPASMKDETYIEQVYAVVKCIPPGRVTTYGAIAGSLGLGSARMIGWALNHSFSGDGVPAHRVVNRKGELSGRNHFHPPARMQELLENEGIEVSNDRVVNFDELFWDPSAELV
jgi:methylated-DNA-protein-cysteine methyltransferase-like protein